MTTAAKRARKKANRAAKKEKLERESRNVLGGMPNVYESEAAVAKTLLPKFLAMKERLKNAG